ncbi:zinc-binding dehydrogenase [Gaopeijia maritima]|uniref:zinc-binding dehydrogenase n=1 Tax=Gaopeijia maritima TaxID=3119007 RepID=UPI003255CF6B
MDTMRAAVFHENGHPEVVVVEERPRPEPGPGEVRIRVRASALNHLDLWVRRGLPIETTMPHIGGSDLAGEVERVGPGVAADLVGTRVVVDPSLGYDEFYERPDRGVAFADPPLRLIGEHTDGGLAEFVVVPAENCVQLPNGVSFEAAAAASLAAVTAWRAVIGRGRLTPGESVLVTGGSGGVSTLAVQVARHAGARVHAVTSGADNVARLRDLGAHHAYDRTDGDWVKALKADTSRRGVDLAIDSVGEAMWESVLRSLAVGGRVVCYGATTGPRVTADLRHVFWKQLSILGSTMGTPAEYRRAMQLVFDGHVEAPIHDVLPLGDTRRAHERLEAGGVFGKLVIRPDA